MQASRYSRRGSMISSARVPMPIIPSQKTSSHRCPARWMDLFKKSELFCTSARRATMFSVKSAHSLIFITSLWPILAFFPPLHT